MLPSSSRLDLFYMKRRRRKPFGHARWPHIRGDNTNRNKHLTARVWHAAFKRPGYITFRAHTSYTHSDTLDDTI